MNYQLFGAPKRYLDASYSLSNEAGFNHLNATLGKGHEELPETWEALKSNVPVALTIYLACYEGMVSREILAELFFARETVTKARSNLRSNLNKLRTHKEYEWAAPYVTANTKSIGFQANSDVLKLEKAFEEKRYQDVVNLYQGEFLKEFTSVDTAPAFNQWIDDQRIEFENKNYIATRALAYEWVKNGEVRKAIDLLHTLLHKDIEQKNATEICQQLLTIALDNGEIVLGLHYYSDYKRALKIVVESMEAELYIPQELELLAQQLADTKSEITKSVSNTAFPSRLTKPNYIPVQATRFIGRDNEIHNLLKQLLDFNTRMISLIGYGGIGKTRLAVQLATALQDYFVDGVFVVELVAIQSVDNIPSTINTVLGIKPELSESPKDALNKVLKDKQLLLVLDNFEHLLEGRDFVDSLLGNNKNLDVIVTSREALNLSWEHIYEIEGLNYPSIKNPDLVIPKDLAKGEEVPKSVLENEALPETVEEIVEFEDYDAVKLFLRSAKARVPDFSIADNKAAIQKICSFVEGLPLGIELAASWVASLSCEKIADTLQKDASDIPTRLKDVPDRHKSLDIVFEHSWALLNEQEKDVLAKTAIFHGGFDNSAAETITGTSLAELATLCDKSLLRVDDTRRYSLHEVIRQNAVRKLIEVPEVHKVTKASHQTYYMDFIDECDYFELADNLENIEAAWFSTIDAYGFDSEILQVGAIFNKIYGSQTMPKRALQVVETSLIKLETHQEDHNVKLLKTNLLRSKAYYLDELGFPEEALCYEEEVYERAKKLNEPTLLIHANHRLAISYEGIGKLEEAKALLTIALDTSEKHNLSSLKGLILDLLARVQNKKGDILNAEDTYKKAILLSEDLNDKDNKVLISNNYCTLLFNAHRYQESKELILETLNFSEENSIKRSRHLLLKKLAQIYLIEKDYELAWNTAMQAEIACNEQGAKKVVPQIMNVFADISLATENISKAQEDYLEALELAIPIASYDAKYAALIGLAKIHILNNEETVAVSLLNSLMQQANLRSSLKSVTSEVLEDLKNALSQASYFKAFQKGNTEFLEQYCLKLFS